MILTKSKATMMKATTIMTTRIKGTGRNSFRQQRQISSSSFGGSGDDGGIYRGNSRRRYFSVLPSSPSSQSSLSAQSPVATSPALIRLLDSRSRSTCSYSHCYRYSSSFSTSSSSTSSAQQASLSSSSAQQPKSKSKNKNKSKKLRSKKRKPYTNSNGNNSNHSLPKYKVAKISDNGEKVQFEIISIIELLKKVHARDLYSLALTSIQEYEFKTKNKGRITGSTRSLVDGHTNTRRNKRSSNTVISPRKETILISFGSIRAVIGLGGEVYIFDAHKPSIQLFAHSIANTFHLLYKTKQNDIKNNDAFYNNDYEEEEDEDEEEEDEDEDEDIDIDDEDEDNTVNTSNSHSHSKLSIGWDTSSEYFYDDDDQRYNSNNQKEQQQEYYHNRFQRLTGLSSPSSSLLSSQNNHRNDTNTNSDNMMIQSQLQSSYIQQESPLPLLTKPAWWSTLDNNGNGDSNYNTSTTTIADEKTTQKGTEVVFTENNYNNEENENNSSPLFEYEKFELIFLEEILKDVCLTYNRRLKLYEPFVDMISIQVSNDFNAVSGVHRLVPIKNSLHEFELNIQSALDGITNLLNDDDDMIGLLLTERYEANQRNEILDINRHESVELLLEEYSRQLSNILAETIYLLKKVQNKQELVAISLDSYRNRIIRMNLYLSIAGISIAYMTTIAGFYGMNIVNGYETSINPYMFTYIVSGTTLSGFLLGIGCYTYIGGNNGASHTRYKERLHEIEIIDGALNKMGALDYTMKYLATMEDNNDNSNSNNSTSDTSSDTSSDTPSQMTRDEFKRKLYESQGLLFDIDNYNDMGDDMNTDNTEFINDKEVDLLFNSLDVTNDGYLNSNDFSNNSNSHTQHFR